MLFFHYLKIAVRRLERNRWYSLINVVALAVGFSCFVLAGYWFRWEHSFDDFHPKGEGVYQITRFGGSMDVRGNLTSVPVVDRKQVEQLLASVPEIVAHCEVSDGMTQSIQIGEEPYSVPLLFTDTSFFSFFSARFIEGGYRGEPVNGSSVILTERLARRLFPGRACTGELVNLGTQRKVAGVIRDYPEHSQFAFDCIVLERPGQYYTNWIKFFVRFADRSRPEVVREKLSNLVPVQEEREDEGLQDKHRYRAHTLQEVHFSDGVSDVRYRNIQVLYGAGWLVLLVVLANHLVLFFTLQQTRLGDNMTYVSFGASVRQLLMKYAAELLLPVVAGGFLSLLLLELLFPYYQSFTAFDDTSRMELSNLYGYSAFLLSMVLLLFGFVALCLVYLMVRRSSRRSTLALFNLPLLRRSAITGQVFIGVLFAVTSLSLYRQLLFAERFDNGLNTAGVIELNVGYSNAMRRVDVAALKERLAAFPEVQDITMSVGSVFSPEGSHPGNMSLEFNLSTPDSSFLHTNRYAVMMYDEAFLPFWGFRLKDGSWPVDGDRSSYLINEAAARKIGYPDAGLLTNDDFFFHSRRICGVLQDYHYAPVTDPVGPLFFHVLTRPDEYTRFRCVYVRPAAGREKEAMELMRRVVDEANESSRMDMSTVEIKEVDGMVRDFYRSDRVIVGLFGVISLFSMLISIFAIYVLVSLSAEQRRKEVAIRKINGAGYRDILRLFVREYLWLVVLANLLAAVPGYLFAQRWLESFTYHIEPGVWFFALIFAVSVGLVYTAVAVQVRRAMREDPARVIQSE